MTVCMRVHAARHAESLFHVIFKRLNQSAYCTKKKTKFWSCACNCSFPKLCMTACVHMLMRSAHFLLVWTIVACTVSMRIYIHIYIHTYTDMYTYHVCCFVYFYAHILKICYTTNSSRLWIFHKYILEQVMLRRTHILLKILYKCSFAVKKTSVKSFICTCTHVCVHTYTYHIYIYIVGIESMFSFVYMWYFSCSAITCLHTFENTELVRIHSFFSDHQGNP